MKKHILLVVFCLFVSNQITHAQSYELNLEKYWHFRERLKTKFIYYTQDASIQGSHIPAERRFINPYYPNAEKYEFWSDGTWWLGGYLTVLAFEYKLLKENGQSVDDTYNEIIWALDAYNRLDLYAESCFGCTNSVNGFFLRDDVSTSNSTIANAIALPENSIIYSDYGNGSCAEISQDQVWSLVLGLKCLKEFVGTYEIQQRVHDVGMGLHNEFRWGNFFKLYNDCENHDVEHQDAIACSFLSYPFCLAFDNLTNGEVGQFSYTGAMEPLFKILENNIYAIGSGDLTVSLSDILSQPELFIYLPYLASTLTLNYKFYNMYGVASLATVTNIYPYSDYNSNYSYLIDFGNQTSGLHGQTFGYYPHLALISKVLCNSLNNPMTLNLLKTGSDYESSYFDICPPCGAYRYQMSNTTYVSSSPPWNTLSLMCPSNDEVEGNFNMIDYMALYLPYFNIYNAPIPPFKELFGYEDCWSNPLSTIVVTAHREIDSHETIPSPCIVEYKAGQQIKLLPPFHATHGCNFTAQIDQTLNYPIYFHKTTKNPCPNDFGAINPASNDLEENFPNNQIKRLNDTLLHNWSLNIFPNPSNGNFTIESTEVIDHIAIYDITGNKVDEVHVNSTSGKINCTNISKGYYLLKVYNNKGGAINNNIFLTY